MSTTEQIENSVEAVAAARSTLYRLLAESFRYPGGEFIGLIKDGTFLEGLGNVVANLPYPIPLPVDELGGECLKNVSEDDFEAEFIRVFDVGPGSPPCPLREGLHLDSRMVVMEELARFYNHFGLSATQGQEWEIPDTLSTELEFLHYLMFKEVVALQHDHDPAPYQRAEKDFLERHLTKWLPLLIKRVDEFLARDFKSVNKPVVLFYKALIAFAERFARNDSEFLAAQGMTEK